jgi:hypothetical protein
MSTGITVTPEAVAAVPLLRTLAPAGGVRAASLLRYCAIALLLGLAWGVIENLVHAASLLRVHSWAPVVWFLAIDIMTAYWAVFLVLLADRVSVRGWPWWMPYVLALTIGGVLGQLAQTLLLQWLIPLQSLPELVSPRGAAMRPAIEYFGYLASCLPAALLYASLRRMRQQTAGLHAVQTEQAELARRVTESRLQSTQTRLDPQELSEVLGQIERLQDEDPSRSLRALDALIRYLRLGVSRHAERASTLRREIAVARSRLELQREVRGTAARLQVSIAGGDTDVPLPAMILQPLLELACAGADSSQEPVRVEATICPPWLLLKVTGPFGGRVAGTGDALRATRERLALLYGARARLDWDSDSPGGVCIVAQLPYEPADRRHR